MKNIKAQTSINNVFLFSTLIWSGFIVFCAGFLNFNTASAETSGVSVFGTFSFGNIIQATTYLWFDAIVLAPILIMIGVVIYDKIRGNG